MRLFALSGVLSLLCASPAWSQIRAWDFFNYPTDPPPQFLDGKTNPSQTDANPLRNQWHRGPLTTGNDAVIIAGSLDYPGLATLGGNNMIALSGAAADTGIVDRLKPGGTGTVSSGTLYYSLVIRVTAAGTPNANTGIGAFIAGFNNSPVTTTSSGANFAGARLHAVTSADGVHFKLGIRNDVHLNPTGSDASCSSATVMDPREFPLGPTSDPVFVVASYEFVGGSPDPRTNDVANLWINPDPSTFGAASPPAPDQSITGCDISQIQVQSFFVRNNSLAPLTTQVDQVRVGSDWASVTSFVPPPPFECPTPPYDTDADSDVDFDDFGVFQRCYGLPAVQPDPCVCFDSDVNGTIDGIDLASFMSCESTSGPGVLIATCP